MVKSLIQIVGNFIYTYPLFMSFLWMIGAIIFYFRHEKGTRRVVISKNAPFFSIIVPCHNEEKQIKETIFQLLNIDYPNYEIVVIDDGSTDQTRAIIRAMAKRFEKVRVGYLNQNSGKATALNTGAVMARGEFILTVDADALLDRDALKWMAIHFEKHPRVGAVTGNPRIINRTSLLAKIQVGEYSTIIGLIKRTQRVFGKVLTVSGAIAAFRKKALLSVGFWDTDMVTEDIDITWKLEKKFWDVRFEPHAICWIYAPETIMGLFRQRMRWSQGCVEVLKKHKDIWLSWNQRRLWPVFIESTISIAWSYCFWLMLVVWICIILPFNLLPISFSSPVTPRWTGVILAITCVLLFLVSLFLDRKYEKGMWKYLYWVIWYPFVYWMISSITVIIAMPKALFKKKGTRATWKSPDRGLQSIKQTV